MTGQISALVREIIDRMYPVSIILDFAAETDPNVSIGCGTQWERMTDGRTLIASDASHSVGWTGGAEEVWLTVEQIPSHRHVYERSAIWYSEENGEGEVVGAKGQLNTRIDGLTSYTGGDQPHTNMQPSLAVCRWRRIA